MIYLAEFLKKKKISQHVKMISRRMIWVSRVLVVFFLFLPAAV